MKSSPDVAMDYDVFISYSSRDAAWVRGELLQRIEQAGLRAIIDYRDFKPGAKSIKEMERAVKTSRWTLLVLTPNYLASEFCEIEGIMSQKLGRLLPLLREECEQPLYISNLTHIDYREGADLELARRQLLTALGAAPEPKAAAVPARQKWFLAHPYPMPPNFTGRAAERAMLTQWLDADPAHPLLVLRALGGFGKSALAWQWLLHDVDPAGRPRVVWWSFYEADAGFDNFLAGAVQYLTGAVRGSHRENLDALLAALRSPGILLVLDGFERVLRAFGGLDAAYQGDGDTSGERDCVSPAAETFLRAVATLPGIESKVLMTTRLRPAAVEARGGILLGGCREEELVQLQPADAVEYFHAHGIRGQRVEIEAACEPYGYHPLSLQILAGWIVGDVQQPGDIAAAQRLDAGGDLVQRRHHVLEQSYDALSATRQTLLSRIACFRSPVDYDVLQKVAESRKTLDADLRDLLARGLLHRDAAANRFDLHPIVRRYAYDRLAASHRTKEHKRLRNYFAAVPQPARVTSVDEIAPVIELYHHTVRAGLYDEARKLFKSRLKRVLYYQLNEYRLMIDLLKALFPDGEAQPPRLKRGLEQCWTLDELANCYSLTGQPRLSVPLFERSIALVGRYGAGSEMAVGWVNLASDQLRIGMLKAAEENFRSTVALCKQVGHDFPEAVGHCHLAVLLGERGAWRESEEEFAKALTIFTDRNVLSSMAILCSDVARMLILRIRSGTAASGAKEFNADAAIAAGRESLAFADRNARAHYREESHYVHGHWMLGAAQCLAGEAEEAERNLNAALQGCRGIDRVSDEAGILVDLARLRLSVGATEEARRLADSALLITERCGYALQGADAHLVLAQLTRSRQHAEEALRLATCDGPPDYTYKAAYDEATALLATL